MQDRRGSSRYPDDLVEKFTLGEDEAKRYVPKEDRTLVINFVEYWNMSAERKGSRRFSPYKNSLKEQFDLISKDITQCRDLIQYIWRCIVNRKPKNIYLSHPSFNKSLASAEDMESVNLRSVTLRIPGDRKESDRYDFVLSGDIVSVPCKDFERREFVVKYFSLLRKSTHFGEKKVSASLIVRVMNSSMQGFYTPDKKLADGFPRNVYSNSVLTKELVAELNRLYIVKNPNEVVSQLNEWREFLKRKHDEAIESEGEGYIIERPEFMVAYPVPAGTDISEDHILVRNGKTVWTDKPAGNSTPRLLVRIKHRAPRRAFETDPDYIREFNRFTVNSLSVIDPLRSLEVNGNKLSRDEAKLLRIGKDRVAPATIRDTLGSDLVQPLRDMRDSRMNEAREKYSTAVMQEVDAALQTYLASEEYLNLLQNCVDDYLGCNPGAADEDLQTYREAKIQELTESQKILISSEAERKYLSMRKTEIRQAWEEFEKALSGLDGKDQGVMFTVHYEIPLFNKSATEEAERRNRFFKTYSQQHKIIIDQVGTVYNIESQQDALESFINGEASNPFLASYIYSTEDVNCIEAEPQDYYFRGNLNEYQKQAVDGALENNGLYLIQGPPGTGKTQVISEITSQEVVRGHRVLITSQNNKAIDNAFERLYRSSLIRPLRLMADEKVSSYEMDYVVDNFYRNLSGSMETKIRIVNDEETRDSVRDKFKQLSELYEEYCDLKKDLDDLLFDIEELNEDYISVLHKIENNRRLSEEHDSAVELITSSLANLDRYDLNTYIEFHDEIVRLFVPATRLEESKITRSYVDSELFGKNGCCNRIMTMEESEFNTQVELLEKNPEYVSIYRRLYNSTDPVSKELARRELYQYRIKHDIAESELSLLSIFRYDIPENLQDVRDKLSRFRKVTEFKLKERLEQLSEKSIEIMDETKDLKELEDIKEELAELIEDKDYVRFMELDREVKPLMQDLCMSLAFTGTFDSTEEMYETIKTRVDSLGCDSDVDLAKSLERVSTYLATQDDSSKDYEAGIRAHLVMDSNVTGMTCTASGKKKDNDRFLDVSAYGVDVVIVDEVSKVPFPELLRPLLLGKTILMVGDHKQLPPMYTVNYDKETSAHDDTRAIREERYKELYETSLFNDMFIKAPQQSKTMLRPQYRMSEQIMNTINRFYSSDGGLIMGCSPKDKEHHLMIRNGDRTLVGPGNSVLFVNTKGSETKESGDTSYSNEAEAEVVSAFIDLIERNTTQDKFGNPLDITKEDAKLSLGVITPYAAQAKAISKLTDSKAAARIRNGTKSALVSEGEERFMVKSVDDFQGDERDIIILSLVRTEKSNFLADFRRINVAMSRARRLLIIVGNEETLLTQEVVIDGDKRHVYKEIIEDIKQYNGYLEAEDILEVKE